MTPAERGDALEIAVEAIEQVILESSPDLRGQAFNVERKKIVNVDGVHHEIDVYVTVSPAKGYESTFIFECKNWVGPVGKNEVIVLSEKIDALRAQHGYFVVKQLTKDTLAQAGKDRRIRILYATEHPTNTPPPEGFHVTANVSAKPATLFRVRGASGERSDVFDVNGKTFSLGGETMLITDFLNVWIEQLYQERLLWFDTINLPEGIHTLVGDGTETYEPGQCVLEGKDIESIRLFVEFGVQVIRPTVISDFEIASRGRAVRLSKIVIRDLIIDTAFITKLND
jgi:hypothetical protein